MASPVTCNGCSIAARQETGVSAVLRDDGMHSTMAGENHIDSVACPLISGAVPKTGLCHPET